MLFLALAGLWATGFYASRRLLEETDPWLVSGMALPFSLMVLLGLGQGLSQLIPYQSAWSLASVALVLALGFLHKDRAKMPALITRPLTPVEFAILMTALSGAYIVMHAREVLGPEDDYWVHFPLIALLARGNFPPPNPFFENLNLHGHFGRDYLIAMLSRVADNDIMLTTWTFNHLLSASAFFMAVGLGFKYADKAGAFLFSLFLFFGISVGSRVGLMDTYDNNNLLVYACLLLLMSILLRVPERPGVLWLLTPLLGVYAIIYETHMILLLGCLLLVAPLHARCSEQALDKELLLKCAGAALGSLLLAAMLGGPIQDLAARALGLRQAQVTHAGTYQEQRVEIHFPKKHLFQILLGPDDYRRRSYVYEGKFFRNLIPVSQQQGYQYTFLLHPKVLLMHWLALYLGLPAGLYLWRKRHLAGLSFWLFGLGALLTPALVDFGPVHEKEYFRWEFAAGFCFAAALAMALALCWKTLESKAGKAAVVLLCLLVMLGGERRLNKTFIAMQKAPQQDQARLASPLYPSSDDWFLNAEVLRLNRDTLELSRLLWQRSDPEDRLLTNFDARSHWELFRESTVAGLAGLRSVGHQSPPPWMPDGIAPFFHTANWTVFWQTLDPRALPALGARWMLVDGDAQLFDRLAAIESVTEVERRAEQAVFTIARPSLGEADPPPLEARLKQPPATQLQSEVAYPFVLEIENKTGAAIDWKGYLSLVQTPRAGTDPGGSIAPLRLWLELEMAEGEMQELPLWLVPPLVEGDYRVEIALGDRSLFSFDYGWSFTELAATVEIVKEDSEGITLDPGNFELGGPLTLGWRIFDLEESRYPTPFGFWRTTPWRPEQKRIEVDLDEAVVPGRHRADLFLVSRSGREVRLERRER